VNKWRLCRRPKGLGWVRQGTLDGVQVTAGSPAATQGAAASNRKRPAGVERVRSAGGLATSRGLSGVWGQGIPRPWGGPALGPLPVEQGLNGLPKLFLRVGLLEEWQRLAAGCLLSEPTGQQHLQAGAVLPHPGTQGSDRRRWAPISARGWRPPRPGSGIGPFTYRRRWSPRSGRQRCGGGSPIKADVLEVQSGIGWRLERLWSYVLHALCLALQ
jgi:hypothetical protein